jgi:nucleotide-binding universal stress UspA family protein
VDVLDYYIRQVARSAGADTHGLGAIREDRVVAGSFPHEPLPTPADEQSMLLLTRQEIIARGAVIRVATAEGTMLVFPDLMRTEPQDYPPELNGPARHWLAAERTDALVTATVQLARSAGAADLDRLYRRSAVFRDPCGAAFCIGARAADPGGRSGAGIAVVLTEPAAHRHRHQAVRQVGALLASTRRWQSVAPGPDGPTGRGSSAGRPEVFLCHNSQDRAVVSRLRDALARRGIVCWMDSDTILPGDQPAAVIEKLIDQVPVVAVIIGSHGLGPWQRQEYYAFLGRNARGSGTVPPVRLVPVLIPGAMGIADLPPFARSYNVVDLRTGWVDGVPRLVAAIRTPGVRVVPAGPERTQTP